MNENEVKATVEVPRWEYARLVRANALLSIVNQIVNNMDAYDCKKILDMMFKEQVQMDDD